MTEHPFCSAFKFEQVLLSLLKTTYLKYRFSEAVCLTWLRDTGLNSQSNKWMLFRDRGKQWGHWVEAIQFYPRISWSCIWSLWGGTFQSASLCHMSLKISQNKSKQGSFSLPAALNPKDASAWTCQRIFFYFIKPTSQWRVWWGGCAVPCASAFYLIEPDTPQCLLWPKLVGGSSLLGMQLGPIKASR